MPQPASHPRRRFSHTMRPRPWRCSFWAGLTLGLAATALPSPPAGGATRTVSNVTQLNSVMSSLAGGDEVVITPGTYNLTTGFYFTANNVTIRSSTGNRDDVYIYGGGMNSSSSVAEIFNFSADYVTIKNLTVAGAFSHAIHMQPSSDYTLIDNVHILNCGAHYIKGGTSTANSLIGGIIQNCLLEQTMVRQNGFGSSHPDNYLGGIDVLGATNYVIRDNVAKNIQGIGPDGGDAGIFMWQNINNPTVERNVVISCNKGIALGNPYNSGNIYHVINGVVRDNFIVRGDDGAHGDMHGMEICYAKGLKVYNNTVYSVSTSDFNAFRTLQVIDSVAVPTVNLTLAYNIIRGGTNDNTPGGNWTETGDITGTTPLPDWFVDPTNGNLRLTESAALAIGHALSLADVTQDFDREARPYGAHPDVGADEWRLAGDLDLDLNVDFSDYQRLEFSFGITTGGTWAKGDFNYDGKVDFSDYQLLEANYDRIVNPALVPEPLTALLIGAGATAVLRRRWRPLKK